MIDLNQVLAKVMGGATTLTQSEAMPVPVTHTDRQGSRQRIWPPSTQPVHGNSGNSGLLNQLGALGVGAAAGGLAGSLLGSKKMREVAGTVLQVGAVAAVGGLAYKAFQNYRQGKPVVPQGITDMLSANTPAGNAQPDAAADRWIPDSNHTGETAMLLLQAMVAAAALTGGSIKLSIIEFKSSCTRTGSLVRSSFWSAS